MKLNRLLCFTFLLFFFVGIHEGQAQNTSLKGKVVDATTKKPMPGVNVLVKGTSIGSSTNQNGKFSVNVPSLQDTLVVSFIGYKKKNVPINGRTNLKIELTPSTIKSEELVVVGYGKQKKTSLTSSVSDVDVEKVANNDVSDVRESLQGLSPGVTIRKNSGNPGSKDISINIRGINTIGNTSPLVLVDGIEQSLSNLDSDEIKNISVLKGPAATSIYGSRGANGVILVTTKSPQKGKLNVSYNGYFGVSKIAHKPQPLGLEESLRLTNAQYANQPNGQPKYTEQEINQYVNSDNRKKYPLQNPFWDVLFRDGSLQHHALSFSGGSENLQSRLSLTLNDEGGIMPNSGSKRYGVSFDNNFHIGDWLDLSTKLTYRTENNKEPYRLFRDFPSIYFQLWHWTQWTVPQFSNGMFGNSVNSTNPLRDATMSGWERRTTDHAMANVKADVHLLDNLTYTMRFGGTVNLHTNKYFANHFEQTDYFTGNSIYDSGLNNSEDYRRRHDRWTWKNLLRYDLTVAKHDFNFLAGYEETREKDAYSVAYREDFYNNDLVSLDAGSQTNWSNGGNITTERLRSVFGRFHYSYNDTYILEANARYDGSSKFYGSNNQYSFFPSFSAGWRVSNEDFWEPLSSVVTEFKLRGSWGKSGNNDVGLYTFFPSLNHTTYDFGGSLVSGYQKTQIANKDLTWETTTQTDLGLDAEFWDGKLGLVFDYYKKQTEGILLTLPISGTVGLNPAPQNAGRVDNEGWELAVTHKNVVNQDFSYSITANVSNNHNKVVSLAETGPYTGFTVTKEGVPLESYWGYKILGFFQNQEEINNYPTYAGKSSTHPGDLKYADLNGDGKISADDKTVIGNHFPHYQFGLNFSAKYKNFDASFFLQGVGQMTDQAAGPPILGGAFQGLILDIAGDYWTPDNRDARFPRPQKFSHKNFQESSWWNVNAAYVRLKNAQFGYTLPNDIAGRVGINKLRFYVSGTNLLTISNALKWGFSPENPANPNANGYYPGTSNFTVGMNLEF